MAYLNSYTQNEGKKGGDGTNDPKIRIVTCIHIQSMRISCRGREKGGTGGGGAGVLTIQVYQLQFSGIVKLLKYTVVVHIGLANNPHTLCSQQFLLNLFRLKKKFLDPHRSACIDGRCPYLLFLVNINTYIVRSS